MVLQYEYIVVYNRRTIMKKAQQQQRKDGLMADAQDVRFSNGKKPAIERLLV
jgi:hypothetical protein